MIVHATYHTMVAITMTELKGDGRGSSGGREGLLLRPDTHGTNAYRLSVAVGSGRSEEWVVVGGRVMRAVMADCEVGDGVVAGGGWWVVVVVDEGNGNEGTGGVGGGRA